MVVNRLRRVLGAVLALALLALVVSPAISGSLAAPRAPRPASPQPDDLVKFPGLVVAFVRADYAGPVLVRAHYTLLASDDAARIVVATVHETRAGSEADAQEMLATASAVAERETARALDALSRRPNAPDFDPVPIESPPFAAAVADLLDEPDRRVKSAVCRPGGGAACAAVLAAVARSLADAA